MSRKSQLLELARALPIAQTKPTDSLSKQRQKVTLAQFRAAFSHVDRAHYYVTHDLGATVAIQADTAQGWRALYDAAIAAEASRPIDTNAPAKPRPNLIPGDYERELLRCATEDEQHTGGGGTHQYLAAS